jgi:hypothetical protein
MQQYLYVLLVVAALAAPRSFADAPVDWGACQNDIKKFDCRHGENDYDVYRCLTKHDNQLSKECYAVTTGYERVMAGQ